LTLSSKGAEERKELFAKGVGMKTLRGLFVSLVTAAALVFTFSLVHAQNESSTSKPSTDQAKPQDAAPAGNAENGNKLYVKDGCYACHGFQAHGGGGGPRVGPNPIPYEVFAAFLRHPEEGAGMPAYTSKVLSDQELADIYAYVKSVPRPPDAKNIPLLK
jgi:mono/diheme cytochrome c family protein